MENNRTEIEIEIETQIDNQTDRQNFEPLSTSSSSEEEEEEEILANGILAPKENLNTRQNVQSVVGAVASNFHECDQTVIGEERLNVVQDDRNTIEEDLSSNDPQSNIQSEEKIQELIHSRLLANETDCTQKEIHEKEKVIAPFRQFPKLLLIPNEIEMFASAICVCERKRMTPFNLSFVRGVFKIKRGKIYRAKKAIKTGRGVGKRGRPCLLNKAEELFVVERLKILSMIGWAPTLDETVEIANQLISSWLQVDYRIQRPLITSNIWVHEFSKRNKLRITRSSSIEYQRIIVNEDMIQQFFQTLKELYEEKEYVSHLIFNMDEKSLKLTRNQTYVVVTPESKKKAFRAQKPDGKLMSVVVTISARGNLLKTLLLMPNKTINHKVFEEKDLFNFASRADLRAIHLLQQHFIDCVVIPGHSSHLLQPLDVGIFRHFKTELKKQQRHKDKKKNLYLVLDHCLNLATSTMRIVEAFNKSGIYPLNLKKKVNDKYVFPTEVKEFTFSNFNRGSRLRISGQILTRQNFIDQLSNPEKRKRKAQLEASKKHIPPHKLFQKLFSDMNNPFQHTPFDINEIDNIEQVSEHSSIENLTNRLISVENVHSSIGTEIVETETNEIDENNLLLNGFQDFQNTINLANNSNRQTIQPQLIRQEINQTSIHDSYDNRPLILPTINNITNTEKNSENNEILTALSPGRTSIHSEKIFLGSNETQNLRENNTTRSFENNNLNCSTPPIPNNNQTKNRTPQPKNRNLDQVRDKFSVVRNLLYQKNTTTPSPTQRILYPSNRLNDNRDLIQYHHNNNLNTHENVSTDYYQPRDPELGEEGGGELKRSGRGRLRSRNQGRGRETHHGAGRESSREYDRSRSRSRNRNRDNGRNSNRNSSRNVNRNSNINNNINNNRDRSSDKNRSTGRSGERSRISGRRKGSDSGRGTRKRREKGNRRRRNTNNQRSSRRDSNYCDPYPNSFFQKKHAKGK
ncbi:zinc finger ccch domain-containing protein [Anaeramoeba flamelloides]|uniref:Zinc finger ccch domain-containing protein n=1 Tax=Anaeramoeba flamelloides TaxID=1746091 RepID=A0AAV7ZQG3_9EUKA|nr:zinc finger ccch domain-containing protein [Anaeramoeba flamelloides]